MPTNSLVAVDPVDREIVDLAGGLSDTWTDIDPEPWPQARQTALTLLVWSGVAQVRLELTATWTDGRRVKGQSSAWGRWQDVIKRALWDAGVREASVQHRLVAARLSREGVEVARDLLSQGDGPFDRLAALTFIRMTVKPGVFRVERLDMGSTSAGGQSVAAAQANASVGNIIVNNTIQIDHGAIAEKVLAEIKTPGGAGLMAGEPSGAPDAPSGASRPQPGKGMPIDEVIQLAEAHVRKHDGAFPGRNKLAEFIGCAPSSVTKAVKRSTYLKARKAEHEASKKSGREVHVSGSMDQFAGGTAPEPPEPDEPDDGEAELQQLIAEQRADQMREERQRRAAKRQRKAE